MALADSSAPALDQLALADFIARGELDRHVRRMRARYRSRRAALLRALSDSLPAAQVSGVAAGLFALVLLPSGIQEQAVVTAAQGLGVGVEGLATHRLEGGPAGLIVGYASLPEPAIARRVALLAEVISSC